MQASITDGGGIRPAMPAFLDLYVLDAADTYARAIAAGAHAIEEPAMMPWGDRRGTVIWHSIRVHQHGCDQPESTSSEGLVPA